MFSQSLTKVLLLALAISNVSGLAIPSPEPEALSLNPAEEVKSSLAKRGRNFCGSTSWIGNTSNASPRATDCSKLANEARRNGDWTFYMSGSGDGHLGSPEDYRRFFH